eukprot:UC4_evm3s1483
MDNEADISARLDELEAITAIFGEPDFETAHESNDQFRRLVTGFFVKEMGGNVGGALECVAALGAGFLAKIALPTTYPSQDPPVLLEITHSELGQKKNFDAICSRLATCGDAIISSSFQPGEPILFNIVEELRCSIEDIDISQLSPTDTSVDDNPRERTDNDAEIAACLGIMAVDSDTAADTFSATSSVSLDQIKHGEPLIDRKSTFQAHLASVTSIQQVKDVQEILLSNGKIARATHNIMAYRIDLSDGQFAADCDDDGEDAAGGRLLHLLQLTDARNVIVVIDKLPVRRNLLDFPRHQHEP